MKRLIVSVDTEEEGRWGGDYAVADNTTENLRRLPRFQAACEQLSVPPTYLIDAPVLNDMEATGNLRRWQDSGMCEVGSHCHPWCNPPLASAAPTSAETFLCNLPPEIQHQKLQWLTDRIADTFGRAPTSYRAGRYGFDGSTASILHDLGYRVDSSVLPMHEYVRQGGPDFRMSRRDPQRIVIDEQGGQLLEIPVTAGFTRPGYDRRRRIWLGLRRRPWVHFRGAGIADRIGIARRVKLSPEGTRLQDLKDLVDACVQDGVRTLVLMLHSSSLAAGFSPYARDAAMLEKLYERLTGIMRYATTEHAFRPMTLTAAADGLLAEADEDRTETVPCKCS